MPASQNLPPFWRYNSPCRQVYFSAFHESPENILYYVEKIKKKKITWIHGYPSLLTALANGVIENNIDLNGQIKFVTIGAENLLSYQREAMLRAFGVEPFQHYVMSEAVANFQSILIEPFGLMRILLPLSLSLKMERIALSLRGL